MRRPLSLVLLALAASLAAPAVPAQTALVNATTAAPLQQAALDAYFYLYPLVSMDLARRQAAAAAATGQPGAAAPNALGTPQDDQTWPHAGMQRVSGWLDLQDGPVVLEMPATEGRQHLVTLYDLWSEAFAVLSKRSAPASAARYAITPPGWNGALPAGMQRLEAPTVHVRLQGLAPGGADAAGWLRALRLTPWQAWHQGSTQSVQLRADPQLDVRTPLRRQLATMPAEAFFTYGAELLRKHPPHAADQPMLASLRRVGILPGRQLAFDKLTLQQQQALRHAQREAPVYLDMPGETAGPLGWVAERDAMGAYGSAYLKRARMARQRPGTELPQEVLSFRLMADAMGQPIDPQGRYVMRFEADALPPGEGFWSLTVFDAAGQPLTHRLGQTSLSDRDPLRYNPDGSLELYLQDIAVADTDRANWLALGPQAATLLMRLYQPAPEALYGRWNPPAVLRVDDDAQPPAQP